MPDLISIIVPVYNASRYLEQCIESILSQTYHNLQIILIDDGSTDDSLEICRGYQCRDDRIQVISQSNGGSVSARKAGLREAEGLYIGFVDADDYIEPEMFERLYEKLREYQADFVHSGMIVDNHKHCNYEEGAVDFSVHDRAGFIRDHIFMEQKIFNALWSKLFKADLVKDAFLSLPEEQCLGEDLLCMCNYLARCRKFYMLKDAFYHYRVYEGSLSHLNWLDLSIGEAQLYGHVLRRLAAEKLLAECGDSAKYRYKTRILSSMEADPISGISVSRYVFGGVEALRGKKVILYGAGSVGRDYYYQITGKRLCELVAWVDKEKHGITNLITIGKPEILRNLEYDLILLAVRHRNVADEIRGELRRSGICREGSVLLWEEPVYIR